MSSINSLVGPAPTTFTRSHGPTNTWLDKYIDNPDHRFSTWFDKYNDPNLNNQGYNTLELRPGMDGFSGPPTLETIPNYNPGSDTGITPLVASRPEEQKMAGMNPILKTIVQYWNDLNSGKYNYTKYEDNDYMGNHAAPFNPLETKWNYRNMQNTLNGL